LPRCVGACVGRRSTTHPNSRRGPAAPPTITPIGYHEGRPPCLPRRKLPRAAPSPSDKLIATNPSIERKGDANPYTSLNGNMFTLLYQARLAIRLSQVERDKFLKKYKTTLFEAYGAVMQEYVSVPDALLENTKELQKYLDASYEYAKTLKPKPTKKKH
jgi:hypothetical protein